MEGKGRVEGSERARAGRGVSAHLWYGAEEIRLRPAEGARVKHVQIAQVD